jgi:hypothetical protein
MVARIDDIRDPARRVIAHHGQQTEEEAVAEDEAAMEAWHEHCD